jgi:hypothetical protein
MDGSFYATRAQAKICAAMIFQLDDAGGRCVPALDREPGNAALVSRIQLT